MVTQADISIWVEADILLLVIKTASDYDSKQLKP